MIACTNIFKKNKKNNNNYPVSKWLKIELEKVKFNNNILINNFIKLKSEINN